MHTNTKSVYCIRRTCYRSALCSICLSLIFIFIISFLFLSTVGSNKPWKRISSGCCSISHTGQTRSVERICCILSGNRCSLTFASEHLFDKVIPSIFMFHFVPLSSSIEFCIFKLCTPHPEQYRTHAAYSLHAPSCGSISTQCFRHCGGGRGHHCNTR